MNTDADIDNLIRAFEAGTWPYEDWHHAQHLAIAVHYLRRNPIEEAARRMLLGVMKYNKARVPQAPPVHVSLTLSWITILACHLEGIDRKRPLIDVVRDVIARFGRDPLLSEHFTKDQLFSRGGTRTWVGPDLRPLPADPPLAALVGLPPQPGPPA